LAHIFAAMKDQKQLDRLVRHARKVMARRKWTQKQLAKATGLSEPEVSRIMHGVNPRWTRGVRIMELDAE